jgi:hypothetical protein
MAQQRKSIRRKSLRHKNRTTLKRGGGKGTTSNSKKAKKITNYFNRQKTGQSNILMPSRQVTPPGFQRINNNTDTMSDEQKAGIQKELEDKYKNHVDYLKENESSIRDERSGLPKKYFS